MPSAVKRMCVMPPPCPVSRQRQLPCGSRYRPSVFLSVAGFAWSTDSTWSCIQPLSKSWCENRNFHLISSWIEPEIQNRWILSILSYVYHLNPVSPSCKCLLRTRWGWSGGWRCKRRFPSVLRRSSSSTSSSSRKPCGSRTSFETCYYAII